MTWPKPHLLANCSSGTGSATVPGLGHVRIATNNAGAETWHLTALVAL